MNREGAIMNIEKIFGRMVGVAAVIACAFIAFFMWAVYTLIKWVITK